jgi:hypothetical protein
MLKRTISISVVVASLGASAAMAASVTDRLEANRMTVAQIDRAAAKFKCIEHQRWTAIDRADAATVRPGDIVRVVRTEGKPVRLVVVRTAADELSSPEK